VLRRVEAGERLRISVNRRPVAGLVSLEQPRWASDAATERVVQEAASDMALLDDLGTIRGEIVSPR